MKALSGALRLLILSTFVFVCAFSENVNQKTNDIAPITTKISNQVVDKCGVNETCVRFCCDNLVSCANLESFNKSSIPGAEDLDEDFKILKGHPSCRNTSGAFEYDAIWSFLKVSHVK